MPTIFDAAQQDQVDALRRYIANGADLNAQCEGGPTPAGIILFKTIFYIKKALGLSWGGLGALGALNAFLQPVAAISEILIESGFSYAGFTIADADDDRLIAMTYDWNGWTPLHFAALGNAERAAIYLVENGADYSIKAAGKTFLDIAKERGNAAFLTKLQGIIQGRESMLKKINDEKEKAQQTEHTLSQARQENMRLMDIASQLAKDNFALRTQRQEMVSFFKQAAHPNAMFLGSNPSNRHHLSS